MAANAKVPVMADAPDVNTGYVDGDIIGWQSFTRDTQWYLWGSGGDYASGTQGIQFSSSQSLMNGHDYIRAWPQIFLQTGTIAKLAWYLNSAAFSAGQKISFAIYSSTDQLYPNARLYNSGEITATNDAGGTFMNTLTPTLAVNRGTVLWAAWNYNSTLSPDPPDGTEKTILMFPGANVYPILGYPPAAAAADVGVYSNMNITELVSNNRFTYGWYKAATYSSGMPTTFPASATRMGGSSEATLVSVGDYTPALFYAFTRST